MLVHATRKTIQESEDKLDEDEKKQVEDAVVSLEEAIASEDISSIESATKNLNDVLTPLTQKLYKFLIVKCSLKEKKLQGGQMG